jgi:hypothetical protein
VNDISMKMTQIENEVFILSNVRPLEKSRK